MDVEGGEWDLLSGILNEYEGEPLPFGQLQVELHAMGKSVTWMVEWCVLFWPTCLVLGD